MVTGDYQFCLKVVNIHHYQVFLLTPFGGTPLQVPDFFFFLREGGLKALPYAWMLSIMGWRDRFLLVTPSPSLSE